MTGSTSLTVALCLGLTAVSACTPRNRAGCDATGGPVADTGQAAIAGVVASESDVIGNGCQECPLGTATLTFWTTSGPVPDDASAKAIVDGGPPTITLQANQRYLQALDPGSYLVCARPFCVNVAVAADHVTTVHLKQIFGPTQFIVFDAQSKTARAATTLEVDP